MGKLFSGYSQDTSPSTDDGIPTKDTTSGQNKWSLLSDLITTIFNNIPAGSPSPITRWADDFFDHVASGGIWSGDNYGVNKNASMTAATIYINGRRISISAVTARVFTASKDTYIDVLDNLDGTGTLVYTEVSNNAASPALAANSVRIGIIVTGATTIAAVGSVNQGQENIVLPIASSIPYTVTDSLGNLICPRDPNRRILGYRRLVADITGINSTSYAQATGLSVPVIIPTGRKIKITAQFERVDNTGTNAALYGIWDGAVTVAGGQVAEQVSQIISATSGPTPPATAIITPSSTSKTYNVGIRVTGGTSVFYATPVSGSGTAPAFIIVELV